MELCYRVTFLEDKNLSVIWRYSGCPVAQNLANPEAFYIVCMMESSTSSGSSKRAKAPGNVAQVAHCLVDGCNADLSLCREYHRRHKVCEAHSKTAKVTIGGREQRFCQQCSRFHSLVEFDDGKRSCRKRLDGHNRRRRKPQPDSMTKNSSLLFTGQQGTKLLSFSNQQIYPTAVVSSAWSNVVKTDSDMVLYNQPHINCMDSPNSFPESSAHHSSYKAGNQFPFMQGRVIPSSSGQKMFSSGLNEIVVDSSSDHRALSLLSSAAPPPPAVTRGEIGLSNQHMVQQHHPPASIPPRPHYYSALSQYHHFPHQDFDSKPSHQEAATANFHEMMQNAPTDGSSSSGGGTQQTLAFMWD